MDYGVTIYFNSDIVKPENETYSFYPNVGEEDEYFLANYCETLSSDSHTFGGWYMDSALTMKVEETTTLRDYMNAHGLSSGDYWRVDLYAKWTEIQRVSIGENILTDIANAIRTKSGGSETYTVDEMAAAILAIPVPDSTE